MGEIQEKKIAVKVHNLLDFDTALPAHLNISNGKKHDLTDAKEAPLSSGSVLFLDITSIGFEWLFSMDSRGVSIVTRLKTNINTGLRMSVL